MTIILFIYGTCIGSWLTAMADRYATNTSPFYPASHCDTCQTPLAHWQLVPVCSYLLLRGRCHYCHASIPATTFIMEVTVGLLLTTLHPTTSTRLIWLGLWGFAALCDARTQTFPGWISYATLPLVLWGHTPLVVLLTLTVALSIRVLWPHWRHPLLGDGDLEMMLSYLLLWGMTATARWVLLASTLALLQRSAPRRIAFLPYLVISAVCWWLLPEV
ncbi:prepilin peptidase [Levilactobacillus wangkuiensis]|uniref:prepilin peptidase n=1 Tax=Levilactobacillus wangkuiensis TaxID=2799566 RepID=UPI00194479DC|nr:A24 family peptidase [Levilactobacillus wangkuiensis]